VSTLTVVPGPAAAVSGEPDLWCSYAAVRTLRWLDRIEPRPAGSGSGPVPDLDGTAAYLARHRNSDGGYAWSRGMTSDAWATFYATQALRDLGRPVPAPERTARWLESTWSGEAYAMMPGQRPDVWATHFSTRTAVEVCRTGVSDEARLLAWLGALQTPDGGLTWSPEHTEPDVRACYYGIAAWRAVRPAGPAPWDVPALVRWLQDSQHPSGGFRFNAASEVPCLWATYRAAGALAMLGARPRHDPSAFVDSLRGPGGGYVRWPGYTVEDVWAAFCAVGALRAVGASTSGIADAVAARVATFACPGGGFTYREPEAAADVLTGAAAVLSGLAEPAEVTPWLAACQLPNEGGVMYMPGRGSEVRCTTWALAAGAFADDEPGRARIAAWLRAIQNPDGGFGYWEGRGSDLVSTAAAVAAVALLGRRLESTVDTHRLARFVQSCATGDGYATVPGATPTLRAGAQALRIRAALHDPDSAALADLLERHRVPGGGFANEGNRVPDLLSTYEAVLAADTYHLPVDTAAIGRFLDRVTTGAETAWTPLGPPTGGALAHCLATLLRARLTDPTRKLPPLTLS